MQFITFLLHLETDVYIHIQPDSFDSTNVMYKITGETEVNPLILYKCVITCMYFNVFRNLDTMLMK